MSCSEDARLRTHARAGDPEAFEELATACEKRLFRQAFALCHDLQVAEDLVAETLIHAWKSIGRYNGACKFSTWTYAILIHRFQHYARATRSRPPSVSALPGWDHEDGEQMEANLPDDLPPPPQALLRKENAHRLQRAISSLPSRHQKVILLRFFEDASLAEIAAVLNVSLGTVKSRLHHALEKLRKTPDLVNLLAETGDTWV